MADVDETKKAGQDTPPGPGQSSGGKEGTTSQKPPKETYTRAEHEKEISDRLAEEGRKRKALERDLNTKGSLLTEAEKKLTSLNTNVNTLQERIDELERQNLGDSPEGVKALQELQAARKERRKVQEERDELEKDKATHAGELKAAQETHLELLCWEMAKRHNANAVKLKDLCTRFKLTTEEEIEEQAKAIAGSGTSGEDTQGKDATGRKPGPTAGLQPASTKGTGGGEKSEEEALKERYPTMFPK